MPAQQIDWSGIKQRQAEADHRYRIAHPEKLKERYQKYAAANRSKINERRRRKHKETPDVAREADKRRFAANREQRMAQNRTWRANNKATVRSSDKRYKAHRIATDINYKMRRVLSARLLKAIKGAAKSQRTLNLLGCSIENFWLHLESRFSNGMTRENHGAVWHVDHIMPCAIFDLTKPEHQRRCFHFSNHQPLFAAENLRKGATVKTNQFQLL